jgi:branched-chain amino acid transport system permease protein
MVDDSRLGVLSLCAVYAVASIGLTILNGKAGQVTMAMPFFMGVGAYGAAYLGAQLGLALPVYAFIAIAIGALIGALMGLLSLRLGGDELAITTLGLLMVGQYLYNEWKPVTGGESGISVRDASVALGPIDFGALGDFTRPQSMFWLTWGVVLVVAYISGMMVKYRPGRAMQAIHDSERSAEAVGVNVRSYKVQVSTFAGAIGALAGVLYAVLQQFVSPTAFGIPTAILLFAMIIIGGMGRVSGAIIGAVVVWSAQQLVAQEANGPILSMFIKTTESGPGLMTVGAFNMLAYGLMIVLVLMYAPKGLVSIWDAGVAWWRRRAGTTPKTHSTTSTKGD